MPTQPSPAPATPLPWRQAFAFAHCNCPPDDDGEVRYHSNCARHLKPILEELQLRTETTCNAFPALVAALDELLAVHDLDAHRDAPQMPCNMPLARRAIEQARAALALAKAR